MKTSLNDFFNMKKSIFANNPGAHFTLKILINQRSGTYGGSICDLVKQNELVRKDFLPVMLMSCIFEK